MAQATPIVFTVTLPGQEPLTIALQRFATDITDFSGYWSQYFLPAWYRFEQIHYETQGASTGAQWAPLSVAYEKWKQKHWPGLPTGVLSGATRESLTFPGDQNAVVEIHPDALMVGSRVPWAMYQQKGTKKMPARPPMRVSQNFMLTIAKLLQEYGHAVTKNSGLA